MLLLFAFRRWTDRPHGPFLFDVDEAYVFRLFRKQATSARIDTRQTSSFHDIIVPHDIGRLGSRECVIGAAQRKLCLLYLQSTARLPLFPALLEEALSVGQSHREHAPMNEVELLPKLPDLFCVDHLKRGILFKTFALREETR